MREAAAGALGFALGGFFDGILLHQILQWHHLLSGLQGGIFQDLGVQVLADGIFHALMYVIAVLGLWLLWRSRAEIGHRGAGRVIAGWGLLGFGIWHVVDAVLSVAGPVAALPPPGGAPSVVLFRPGPLATIVPRGPTAGSTTGAPP